MNENGQLMNPTVSEKRMILQKRYTIVISFFLTVLTILIVCVIDIENKNKIAYDNNAKTKGKLKTIDITYAKLFSRTDFHSSILISIFLSHRFTFTKTSHEYKKR